MLRHRERQAADLRGRLEDAKVEAEALRRSLSEREAQLQELQENIKMLTEKNKAKQEVQEHDSLLLTCWKHLNQNSPGTDQPFLSLHFLFPAR